jgi:ABC-type polysaccharide/polyol phosphate export permease
MLSQTMSALKNIELWSYLGWVDVAQRYKRSSFGPFWLTANNAIITIVLSIIWANLFKIPLNQFLPYFALSNVSWIFVSTVIAESTTVITAAEGIIRQIKIPVATLFFRMIWKNIIILAHLLPIPVVTFLIFPEAYKGGFLGVMQALIGLSLLSVFLYLVASLVGILCTRYRDIAQLIGSALTMIFLATPILWQKNLLQGREILYEANIFFHLIELVRAPILEGVLPVVSLIVVVGCIIILGVILSAIEKRYQKSIVYWI